MQPSDLGFSATRFPEWRDDQEAIVDHLFKWHTSPGSPKFMLLEAPTGIGKSLIAGALLRRLQDYYGASHFHGVITTTTRNLQTQYVQDTLTGMAASAWGKANHECLILPPGTPADVAPCTYGFKCSQKSICPYYVERDAAHTSPISILNTAFYLTATNHVKTPEYLVEDETLSRPMLYSGTHLAIHDEAHLIEKAVISLIEVNLSRDFFERTIGFPFPKTSETAGWASYVDAVFALVESLADGFERKARVLAKDGQLNTDKEGKRAVSALRGLRTLRDELLPSRPLIQQTKWGFKFQPVWGKYFAPEYLWNKSQKHLLMSATIIRPEFLAESLGISPDDYQYVSLDSPFAPMRRRLMYEPVVKVTYKTSNDEFKLLVKAMDDILRQHSDQKGIIHTVSYARADLIYTLSAIQDRMITHSNLKGSKESAIATFLDSEDGILVSPSVGVGEDFGRGDNCRFQIFPKYPIPNLGDPLTRARQEDNPETIWYEADMAFVQALGRGMRSADDFVTNYVLDAGAGWRLRRLPAWVQASVVTQQ